MLSRLVGWVERKTSKTTNTGANWSPHRLICIVLVMSISQPVYGAITQPDDCQHWCYFISHSQTSSSGKIKGIDGRNIQFPKLLR